MLSSRGKTQGFNSFGMDGGHSTTLAYVIKVLVRFKSFGGSETIQLERKPPDWTSVKLPLISNLLIY